MRVDLTCAAAAAAGLDCNEAAGTKGTKLSCTHRRALLGRHHRRHAAVAVGLEHALKGAKRQGDGGGGLDPAAWTVRERPGRWGEGRSNT